MRFSQKLHHILSDLLYYICSKAALFAGLYYLLHFAKFNILLSCYWNCADIFGFFVIMWQRVATCKETWDTPEKIRKLLLFWMPFQRWVTPQTMNYEWIRPMTRLSSLVIKKCMSWEMHGTWIQIRPEYKSNNSLPGRIRKTTRSQQKGGKTLPNRTKALQLKNIIFCKRTEMSQQ